MYQIKEICIFIALGFLIDNVFVISDIPNSTSSLRQSEYAILFFSQVLAIRDQRKNNDCNANQNLFSFPPAPKKKGKKREFCLFLKYRARVRLALSSLITLDLQGVKSTIPSSGAASICMLKRPSSSEVPAPSLISI